MCPSKCFQLRHCKQLRQLEASEVSQICLLVSSWSVRTPKTLQQTRDLVMSTKWRYPISMDGLQAFLSKPPKVWPYASYFDTKSHRKSCKKIITNVIFDCLQLIVVTPISMNTSQSYLICNFPAELTLHEDFKVSRNCWERQARPNPQFCKVTIETVFHSFFAGMASIFGCWLATDSVCFLLSKCSLMWLGCFMFRNLLQTLQYISKPIIYGC